ncbi:conjugative relaxase, partial [Salmonella enterica subsp. enterica serovar Newport]|nr:conjugative relaxase [Salmonella enterica subsp. enterica serovar Newport]
MLSISSIKGDAGYYSHEDNYYASGSLDSRWMGEGAEKLGLKGEVASADMDAVRQGILPDGSDLSRMVDGVNKHRSGYDLTFSAPKSVSVMALVGEDRRFIEAHNRAVAVVMKEVEQLVSARITQEGKTETVLTGSMVAALYNHDTSRDLDPQVHTHALVFNATFADEKWRSLASDTRMKTGFSENLYATKIALGNLYRSALREDIESMGFETVAAGKHGLWELKDVPVDIFSSRSQAIREAAGPDASAKSRDVAALDTRQAKAWADPDLLKADWRRRLTDEKFDIGHYISQAQARVEITAPVVAGQGGMRAPGQPGIASSGEAADELVQKAVSDTISALS